MSHELSVNVNGKVEMMYVGEKPWHGIGTELPSLATAAEAIEAASLNWRVSQEPVRTSAGIELTDKRINFREDSGAPLGVVGTQYQILQNAQAFEFLDSVTQDPRGPKYETAGALWGGRKIWALARMPESFDVRKGDEVVPYILLCNSHDGSSAIRIQETPIRVVCQNTLNMAIWDAKNDRKKAHVRHSGDVMLKVQKVQDLLGMVRHNFEQTFEVYQALAKVEPTKEQIETVLKLLIPDTKSNRATLQRERVRQLAEVGLGNGKGSAWDLYNGLTELEDHVTGRQSDDADAADRRLNSVWFGSGYDRKADALQVMMETFLN
jgi:phage/plasmid-like protein (TIGR03299 family)